MKGKGYKMNRVYKIATRWGSGGRSIYKVFIDNNIVFFGTDNNEKLIHKFCGIKEDNGYFVITDGFKIKAIAKCVGKPMPLKKMFSSPESIIDDKEKVYYSDHVWAVRVKIEVLRKDENDEIVCPEEYKKTGRFFEIPKGDKYIEQFNKLYNSENTFDINACVSTLCKSSKNNYLIKNNVYYSIPVYQRPYSWKREQVQVFVKSIFECYREAEPLFAGTIQLTESFENDGKIYQDIIDGQQRLSTLVILLKLFAIKYNDEKAIKVLNAFHIETKVTKEQQTYLEELLNVTQLKNLENTKNIYLINLDIVNQLIDEEVCDDTFIIEKFITYILESLYFVVIETKAGISKNLQIFNTINTTGLKIDEGEIFKIKLFEYLRNKNPNEMTDEEINGQITGLYSKVDRMNKERNIKPVAFNGILRLYQDYLFAKTENLPKKYFEYGTVKFFELFFDEKNGISKSNYFNSQDFSVEEFERIIDAYFRQIDINNELNNTDLDSFFYNKLLGFIYPSYSIYKRTLKLLLVKNSNDLDTYKTYLELFTKFLVKNTLKHKKSVKDVHDKMRRVIKALVASDMNKVYDELKIEISKGDIEKQIFDNDHWKMIICYISAFLCEKNDKEVTIDKVKNHLFSFSGKNKNYDIEHIYPRNDSNNSDNKIPENRKGELNSIGNLVLLEYDINRAIGNKCFEEKREQYRNYKHKSKNIVGSQILEVQEIANNEVWNIEKIEERKKNRVEKIKEFLS